MAKKPVISDDISGDDKAGAAAKPYVVLARKYRPRTFEDMIGQEALVTTLRNAFKTGRIAQAYMLTGVRGIGKTTTARILARALNYERDGVSGPTVDMPELGKHCAEIMESRHPDIIEMDAASNTSVDDVREIIENARYKPLIARYKVFIIDEVHMLSKNAFNALLKTLEEPPEHVKFIFATTEIRKVPVTVLSRCQRFDLRRVDVPTLSAHFDKIVKSEGATAEPQALALISRAAEGSVRDGLSILDQAIATGSGAVSATTVRGMLGLADRGRILDLLEHVLGGHTKDALAGIAGLHKDGADVRQVVSDLAEAVHIVTRVKVAGAGAIGDELAPDDSARVGALAATLSVAILSRAWQMLLKGHEEIGQAGDPLAAADMVLIRIAFTADLPTPDDVIKALGGAQLTDRQSVGGSGGQPAGGGGGAGDKRAPLNAAPNDAAPVASAAAPKAQVPKADASKVAPANAPKPSEAKSSVPKSSGPPPWEDAPDQGGSDAETGAGNANEPPPAMSADAYGADAGADYSAAEFGGAEVSEDMAEMEADIGPAAATVSASVPVSVNSFEAVVELASVRRDAMLKIHLEDNVSLVRFDAAQGLIELFLMPGAPKEIGNHLRERLNVWTGRKWMVALAPKIGAEPLGAVMRRRAAEELETLKKHPAVEEVLKTFPDAKIVSVRPMARQKRDDKAGGGSA